MASVQKNLIILDVNGLLVRKIPADQKTTTNNVIRGKTFTFEIRPGTRNFLKALENEYDVAIWTSTTFSNINPIINALFTPAEKSKLAFIWMRDHVRYDPDYGKAGKEDIKEYDTVKILKDVYENAMFQRKWSDKNTIIVDDSPNKVRFNNESNTIITGNYNDPTINHMSLDDLLKIIHEKMKLRVSDTV